MIRTVCRERVNLFTVTRSNKRKDVILLKYENLGSIKGQIRSGVESWNVSIYITHSTVQYKSYIHNHINAINRWIQVCRWMRNINYQIFTYFWVRFGVDLIFHFTGVFHHHTRVPWSFYSILTKTEVRKRSSYENVETLQRGWNKAS